MSELFTPPDFLLPKGWRFFSLESICTGYSIAPHSTPKLTDSGPFVIRTQDIISGVLNLEKAAHVSEDTYKARIKRAEPMAGDILYSREGTYFGIAAEIPKGVKVCLDQRMVLIKPKENVNARFVRYWLNSSLMASYIEGFRDGSVAERLNLSTIRMLPVRLPDVAAQNAIVTVISSLDDKIDLLHRQNRTLEGMAETLFRQWFVEETDEGWEEGCLGDVLELVYGKGLKRELRTGTGYPVVGSSGIVGYHSEYLVEGPGIVIGRKGTLGKVIYLDDNFFPIDTTYYIKSKVNSVGLFYECFLLKTLNFEEMNSDSAVPGLNRNIALSTEIKIPPVERLHHFNQESSPLLEKVKMNTSQIRTLEKLRDTLLSKLMSGEVRVAEAPVESDGSDEADEADGADEGDQSGTSDSSDKTVLSEFLGASGMPEQRRNTNG